jgi:hypothetical protein
MSLYAKRLEKGRFIWPSPADGVVAISAAQLAYMLEGIDWRNPWFKITDFQRLHSRPLRQIQQSGRIATGDTVYIIIRKAIIPQNMQPHSITIYRMSSI